LALRFGREDFVAVIYLNPAKLGRPSSTEGRTKGGRARFGLFKKRTKQQKGNGLTNLINFLFPQGNLQSLSGVLEPV